MEREPVSLYSTADTRRIDELAIMNGTNGYTLMRRAATESVQVLRSRFPGAKRILVLCGAGNNAGDGYLVADLVREWAQSVSVCALRDPSGLKGDAAKAWRQFCRSGGELTDFHARLLNHCDVVVDALLGTGLSRVVEGAYAQIIDHVNAVNVPVVSLDVPSGLNSDSGFPYGRAIQANVTVTFVARKIGLFSGRAKEYCGDVIYRDLGIPKKVFDAFKPQARLLDDRDARACLAPRKADAHKGDHGKVLIVGGAKGMSGAVSLAAEAALRCGAGTVTVACHPENTGIVSGHMPELMCHGVTDTSELDVLVDRCDLVALGPGLGQTDWSRRIFEYVVRANKPMVIDADGLRLLAECSGESPKAPRILTPHPGEAAALMATDTEAIQLNRVKSAFNLANKYESVVVLKGAGSLVVSKTDPVLLCDRGNPGMATAGSGDVLTGICAGLWAQQGSRSTCAFIVAAASVFIHARCGDLAARDGLRGMLASDLIKQVRTCVNPDI